MTPQDGCRFANQVMCLKEMSLVIPAAAVVGSC
jgi:hypothetical protein